LSLGIKALVALLALMLTVPMSAQETRPDLAAHLHRLIDQRIEQLRAELHREIDTALVAHFLPLSLRPVSDEFRELHRLPKGCGLRVDNGPVEIAVPGACSPFRFETSDVLVRVDDRLVRDSADLGPLFHRAMFGHELIFVRRGEWMRWDEAQRQVSVLPTTHWGYADPLATKVAGPARQPVAPTPAETAAEMTDRLWNQALQKVMPVAGSPVLIQAPGTESQPFRK
jgi:hypothetical protein